MKNNINGYLIEPNQVEDFYNKLLGYINSKDIQLKLSKGAIDFMESWNDRSKFNIWDNILEFKF